MNFLEAFTIYCAIKESPSLNLNERKETESNNLIVAIEGRKEDVTLQRNDKSVKLKDWANEIIDEMGEIMTILDINQETYKRVINDPQETTSAKYLNMILDSNYSFHEIGLSLADDNASYYQKLSSSDNKNWKLLSREAKESEEKRILLEKSEDQTFDEYLKKYFLI